MTTLHTELSPPPTCAAPKQRPGRAWGDRSVLWEVDRARVGGQQPHWEGGLEWPGPALAGLFPADGATGIENRAQHNPGWPNSPRKITDSF